MIALRLGLPLLAVAAAMLSACATTETTAVTTSTPTSIVVDPTDFLGDVVCSDSPGALESFVATITDVTFPEAPFTLPSSPPVLCATPVYFRYAIVGHQYSAEVDGYEVPPDALTPFGGEWSGARQMLASGTTNVVTPRWRTTCSDQPSTVAVAQYNQNIFVSGCAPLSDNKGSITGIELDFATALGELRCDAADGGTSKPVATIDVVPRDSTLTAYTNVACDLGKVFYAGVVAGQQYVFDVVGRAEKGGPVVWGGRCFAKAAGGATTLASCDPLTDVGDVRFDATPVLAAAKILCTDGVFFTASVGGVSTAPAPCNQTVRMGPLPGGQTIAATLTVTQAGATPKALAAASCSATIVPGQIIDATCK